MEKIEQKSCSISFLSIISLHAVIIIQKRTQRNNIVSHFFLIFCYYPNVSTSPSHYLINRIDLQYDDDNDGLTA